MSEELLVRNCAPTLAGLKTGSLFSCAYGSREALYASVRAVNRRLNGKGLRVLPLRWDGKRALIYVYRPGRLARDLSGEEATDLLARLGYPRGGPERRIASLMRRLQEQGDFPHEIGLFLGYPTEDVAGFIENHAKGCKCVGCWKVYGDEQKARRTFERYKKCTAVYCRCLADGATIERLTVPAG